MPLKPKTTPALIILTSTPLLAINPLNALESNTVTEDLDDEIVVTASRRQQPINEIARSVKVINEQDLSTQLTRTANVVDLLGTQIPGFGAPTNIDITRTSKLRGRDPQYLLDGVPLEYNGGSAYRTSPLTKFDPLTLGRVEVLYGPTSIYGAGAAGGVVQFFTEDAAEEELKVTARLQSTFYPGYDKPFGSESLSYTGTVKAEGDLGMFDYIVSYSHEEQNGVIDGNGNISGPTYYGFYDTKNLFVKLGFDIDENQRVQGFYNRTTLDEDKRVYDRVDDGNGHAIAVISPNQSSVTYDEFAPSDKKEIYTFKYSHDDLFGGQFEAVYYKMEEALVSRFIDLRGAASRPTWPAHYPSNYQTTQDFEREGLRLQYARDLSDKANFIVGLDYDDQAQAQRVNVYDIPASFDDDRVLGPINRQALFFFPFELETLGAFLQVDYQFTDVFRFTAGLRYEKPDFVIESGTRAFERVVVDGVQVARPGGSGGSDGFSFNLGATYDLSDSFTVFANFAQALELPSINQVAGLVPPDASLESDDAIEPQIIDNYEIGFRGSIENLTYGFAAFYSESEFGENFLYDAATGLGQYNRAPERIYGFEIIADWQVTPDFTLSNTFAWNEGEFDADGSGPGGFQAQSALDVQPWKLTVAGDYTVHDNLSLNFLVLTIGDRDSAFDDGTDLYEISGYTVADIGGSYKLPFGTLNLQVTNLFDKQYLSPASQTYANNGFFNNRVNPAPGRAISLAYEISF